MKQQIRELRVRLDGLKQLTESLKPIQKSETKYLGAYEKPQTTWKENSKEITKAVDSLLMSKAWLGKLLGELGEESPYSSGKKTVEDIEPTADVAFPIEMIEYNTGRKEFKALGHIEKVDWLRSSVQEVIDEMNSPEILHNVDNGLYWNYAYKHLCEARFWLGLELSRIKEENS